MSDESLCSSKWAIIFEQTTCSCNLHGTQVRETGRVDNCKDLYFFRGDICLQVTIP